jgi:hypothetical protein
MPSIAVAGEHAVARPLRAFVPLIQEQFDLAEKAGKEYYRAAGKLLAEVRETHFEGDAAAFFQWAQKNFGKSPTTIRSYIAFDASSAHKQFKSLNEMNRAAGARNIPVGPGSRIQREWTRPVDAVAERARAEQQRLAREDALTRQQERQAEAQLGLRLIDIGLKVLARELHPDKGGSRDAMTRLNRVRDRLKACV